ncbi:hypothetical protein SOV_37570 [Sporomusa ovata DSM 2662]|uniref:Uncharacterized protein n=1 Tax=Sporomusa ovata TaxID=2378 RepID=A0A0U1KSX6_9FIRM|nr:hypothetical protein [Sporomusa ovata]EQB26146.1 hypothetical protein SOV_3c00200 [Sporomusa ovata DSM 2662]CQR70219.1 hypothetical protein SpAn4DRAFT_1188 [Sporomusa ovata]
MVQNINANRFINMGSVFTVPQTTKTSSNSSNKVNSDFFDSFMASNTQLDTVPDVYTNKKVDLIEHAREPYIPTVTYRPLYNMDNNFGHPFIPKNSFEQQLTAEDAEYFHYLCDGNGGRIPNIGAPIHMREEWLSYSKEMAKDGFKPADLMLMFNNDEEGNIIWVPPKDASVEAKSAWCEAARTYDTATAGDIFQTTLMERFFQAAGMDYYNIFVGSTADRVNKQLSQIFVGNTADKGSNQHSQVTSYTDIFSKMLDNLQEEKSGYDSYVYKSIEDWIISTGEKFKSKGL